MPQLQTYTIRGRRSSGRRGRAVAEDDDDEVRVPKQSLAQQAPPIAAMPFYPAPATYMTPPMFSWPKKARKKTQMATKPAPTGLGTISSSKSFFGVDLNLFTLLAIIGIIAVLVVTLNMKSQISGLESKLQVMLATM